MIVPGYRDNPTADWETGAPADPGEAERSQGEAVGDAPEQPLAAGRRGVRR